MKQTLKLLFIIQCILWLCDSAFAQAPQAIPYQAIARDANGNPLPNQPISIRISLIDSNINSIDYQETHSVTTNNLGLFNLNIGQGTPVSGSFSAIYWPISGNEYVQVELDATGGTNYMVMGASKLNSVPFALHANTSGDNKWYTNGSSIYNNNAGNVGIGTTSPGAKLDVNGMAFFRNNAGGLVNGGGSGVKISTENNKGNIFGFDYTNFSPIDLTLQGEGGNVGIGNHFPESTLHITKPNDATTLTIGGNSQAGQYTALRLQTSENQGGYSNIQSIKYSGFDWGDLILNRDGGNVGIGTATPSTKLDVVGSIKIADGTQGSGKVLTSDANGVASWQSASSNFVDLSSNQTVSGIKTWNDLAVFNNKIGIGTNSPTGPLDVEGPIPSGNAILDQQSDFTGYYGGGNYWQSFTAGVSGYLTAITVKSYQPNTVTLNLYAGTGTGGTFLGTGNAVTIGTNDVTITLNSPIHITAGNVYTFQASASGFVYFAMDNSNTYTAGISEFDPGTDLYFKTFVIPEAQGSLLLVKDARVGILTAAPSSELDVHGKTTTTKLQVTEGASSGKILMSDASGNASWSTLSNTLFGNIAQGLWTDNIPSRRIGVMDANIQVAGMEIENTSLSGNYSQKLHLLSHHYANSYGRRMTIDEDGNIGIGIETPSSLLHVNGTGQFGDKLKIGTNVAEGYFQNSQDGAYRALQTGGTQGYWFQNYNGAITSMYVGLNGTYQGRVGIGNVAPSANLDVSGSTKTQTLQITNGAANGAVLTSDATGNATWVAPIGCVIRAQTFTAAASGTSYTAGSAFAPTTITATGIYGDSRLVNSGAMNVTTGSATNTGLFTAPSDGYYQIAIKAISVASSVRMILLGSLNGATPVEIFDQLTSNPCANCSDISHTQIIYMQAGDTHRILRSASGTAINDMIISYKKL